jgi:energy-coupling factor transporter ATP-binding protein EcfA2
MVQAGRLPVPAAPIFGREDELARIPRWIREGARLVTLTGHPGSGKTRLALHAARQVRQDHGWPAEFLPLAPLTSADQIAGALARSLDVREDALPITERVQRLLVELGPMLLVLDNLEHLDGAGMTVDYLLGGCPELRVLATSRKPLRAHGERVLEVLAFPAPSLDESTRISIECNLRRHRQCFFLDHLTAPVNAEGPQTLQLVILHGFCKSLLLLIIEIGFRHRDDVLLIELGSRHVDLDTDSGSTERAKRCVDAKAGSAYTKG